MANKKNPKVNTVIGIVRIVSIGFTILFKKANTTATNKADKSSSSVTPGNNRATKNTATAETIILRIKLMLQKYDLLSVFDSIKKQRR